MDAAVAQLARFVARPDVAPVLLRDVEDLHGPDLDQVLADRLADAYDAAVVADALAKLVGESGPVALLAHDLGL
jgi:hypothetical protein